MSDYKKFKQFIADLFMGYIDDSGDIKSTTFSRVYMKGKSFSLRDSDIKNFFELSNNINCEGVEFISDHKYEIGCLIDESSLIYYEELPICIDDKINNITYEIGIPSCEYTSFIISSMSKNFNAKTRNVPSVTMVLIDYIKDVRKNDVDILLKDLLPRMIGIFSICIKSKDKITVDEFRGYKTAIEFHFMYKNAASIVGIGNLESLFASEKDIRWAERENLGEPPLRSYDSNVVDYYKVAFSSENPYIKYISFYHVIEYFYEEVYRKNIIDAIRNKITNPSFSYKNDEKVYEIASLVKSKARYNDESGHGNEKDSLEYVLKEYISIDELKERIEELKEGAVDFYGNNAVAFCNGSIIQWKNIQGVYTNLAKRIYETRNALIHSKSGKNHSRYKPYEHERLLVKELPLIRAVAELVIINSSEII